MVAPPTGAWIETEKDMAKLNFSVLVAPPTGAWIETNSADERC